MTSAASIQRALGAVAQIAFVVPSMDEGLREYSDLLGLGPWSIYTFAKPRVQAMTYRGEPGDFSMSVAFGQWGDTQIELVAPVSGRNLFQDVLESRGPGIHHLGFVVPDIGEALAAVAPSRIQMIQSASGYGMTGDGAFAYLDTWDELGIYLEVIERPSQRFPPDRTYP